MSDAAVVSLRDVHLSFDRPILRGVALFNSRCALLLVAVLALSVQD